MASVHFGIKLSVRAGVIAEGLSRQERTKLFGASSVSTRRAGRQFSESFEEAVAADEAIPERQPLKVRLKRIAEGYRAIEVAIDERLDHIASQSEGLTFRFSPEERGDLADALSQIFKGEVGRITYKMYLAACKLDKEISLQLGEALANEL